jgi:four helix bundle protein
LAYQKGFDLSMKIFVMSKNFPQEERYALTSQIVRSSRAVCSAIAEAYRKRQYVKHFKSKLSDVDSENSETQLWLILQLLVIILLKKKMMNYEFKVLK